MAIENNADSAYKTPIESFNAFMSTWMQNSKDASIVTQYATIAAEWLQGITWNMLFNDEYRDVLHSRKLTDRILKHHLRSVNIRHGIGKLLTDVTFVVWSRQKPDFKKNI